jgi:predicted aspartyl protease
MLFNRLLGFVLLIWAFLVLSNQPTTAQQIQQPVSITISENLVYVPVRLSGQGPYHFMLDISEPGLGRIDQHIAKELGLIIVGFDEITTGLQVKRAFLVGINKLSVGQIAQSNLKLQVGELNPTPRQIPIDGIIGRAFFDNYALTVNGPARQLLTSANSLSPQNKTGLTYTNAFLVPGTVGSKKMVFNLTTGLNPYLLFPTSALEGVNYTTTPNQRVVTQAGTSFVLHEAIVHDEIKLGGLTLKNQTIYVSDKAHQINVGTDFLKAHTITLDQRTKFIRIE